MLLHICLELKDKRENGTIFKDRNVSLQEDRVFRSEQVRLLHMLTFFKSRWLVDTLEHCQYFSGGLLQRLDHLTDILDKGQTL